MMAAYCGLAGARSLYVVPPDLCCSAHCERNTFSGGQGEQMHSPTRTSRRRIALRCPLAGLNAGFPDSHHHTRACM